MAKGGVRSQFKPPKFLRDLESASDISVITSPESPAPNSEGSWNQDLLTQHLGPPERRLELQGSNFRIRGTGQREGSLFRALAWALTGSPEDWKLYNRKVLAFIKESSNLRDYFPRITSTFRNLSGLESATRVLGVLERHSPGTLIELHAAARKFRFTFSTVSIEEGGAGAEVHTCHDPGVSGACLGAKYYFLRWGGLSTKDWHWELLDPIGPLLDIGDGSWAYTLKEAFVFPTTLQKVSGPGSRSEVKSDYRHVLSLPTSLVFANGFREFSHQVTGAADIYSILSEALFRTPEFSDDIKAELRDRRLKLGYLFNLCPRRKESLKHGKLTKKAIKFATPAFENGDPTDLKLAASIFKFSYTIFGIVGGEAVKEWETYVTVNQQDEPEGQEKGPWFGFIFRSRRLSPTWLRSNHEWFLLRNSDTLRNEHNFFRLGSDEADSLLEAIKPVMSQYYSRPFRATEAALQPQSWFSRMFSGSSAYPTTLLLPSDFPSSPDQPTRPILRVKSATARQIQFDLFHEHQLSDSFLTHPDLNYYPVNVVKTKPSTALPLLARAYCKPSDQILPALGTNYPELLHRQSSYSRLRSALHRLKPRAGPLRSRVREGLRSARTRVSQMGTRTRVGLEGSLRTLKLFLGRQYRSLRRMGRAGVRSIVQLGRNVASHFGDISD